MDKKKYHSRCVEFVQARIQSIEKDIAAIRKDLGSETKSSAGDKFETSREMMKQEENKGLSSLSILNSQLILLQSLTLKVTEKIELGSLVNTDKGLFFISTALGVVKTDKTTFFAISTDAPIYEVLKGKMAGDSVAFNGNSYKILEVQ